MPGGCICLQSRPGSHTAPSMLSLHAHPLSTHPPPSPTWGVGVPQSYREFNPEARRWRGWGCQVNRPCRIQQAMEPRPPKEQPNGRLEGKAEAQITPTQRASHRVRPARERHRVTEDALGSAILLQECRGGALGEEPHVFLHLPLVEKFTLFCGWMGVSEPVVTSAWLCGSVSTTLACVCVRARACMCVPTSEGCSHCILLILQKHIKAGQLIQSFVLPLFQLLDLIDKNAQANDQFHGLFPLLSIQGIVSCHLVPPLQRENSNIYDLLL